MSENAETKHLIMKFICIIEFHIMDYLTFIFRKPGFSFREIIFCDACVTSFEETDDDNILNIITVILSSTYAFVASNVW